MGKIRISCRIRASSTVEAAVIMGVAQLCIMLVMFAGMHLHDTNILAGAAYESVQVAKEWERMEENKSVEAYFQKRIQGKMLYYSGASCTVGRRGDEICVRAGAATGRMRTSTAVSSCASEPEKEIRKLYSKQRSGES